MIFSYTLKRWTEKDDAALYSGVEDEHINLYMKNGLQRILFCMNFYDVICCHVHTFVFKGLFKIISMVSLFSVVTIWLFTTQAIANTKVNVLLTSCSDITWNIYLDWLQYVQIFCLKIIIEDNRTNQAIFQNDYNQLR